MSKRSGGILNNADTIFRLFAGIVLVAGAFYALHVLSIPSSSAQSLPTSTPSSVAIQAPEGQRIVACFDFFQGGDSKDIYRFTSGIYKNGAEYAAIEHLPSHAIRIDGLSEFQSRMDQKSVRVIAFGTPEHKQIQDEYWNKATEGDQTNPK